MIGGNSPPRRTETEEWNGTAWTEVADIPAATNELSGAGTASLGLTMGGRTPSPGALVTTLEWSGVATVQTVAFD